MVDVIFEVYMKFQLLKRPTISAIISFNMPHDIMPHFVSGADLGIPWVDPFYIAHNHPLGGVHVHFRVHEV